jgi:AcrR family transcriptional regulator
MTRLPEKRLTHLSPGEIVAEAIGQYDASPTAPTIRSIAASLEVAPSAIYHHFPSRSAIVEASVEAVWNESIAELLGLVPNPLEADPEMVLVAVGVATRRVWCRHYRLAPYLAASPPENEFFERSVALMTSLFGRLVEDPERAAAAFHSYSSFMIGAALFAATRLLTDEQLALEPRRGDGSAAAAEPAPNAVRIALDRMMALGAADPAADEEQYVRGLHRLVASLTSD